MSSVTRSRLHINQHSKGLTMNNLSYDFLEGQLCELFQGVPHNAWPIYEVPDDVLRAALAWNDKDGDFAECDRQGMLEIFLHDFVVSRAK